MTLYPDGGIYQEAYDDGTVDLLLVQDNGEILQTVFFAAEDRRK